MKSGVKLHQDYSKGNIQTPSRKPVMYLTSYNVTAGTLLTYWHETVLSTTI